MADPNKQLINEISLLRSYMMSSMSALLTSVNIQTDAIQKMAAGQTGSTSGKTPGGKTSGDTATSSAMSLFTNMGSFFSNLSELAKVTPALATGLKQFDKLYGKTYEKKGKPPIVKFLRDFTAAITLADQDENGRIIKKPLYGDPNVIEAVFKGASTAISTLGDSAWKLAIGLRMFTKKSEAGGDNLNAFIKGFFNKKILDKLTDEKLPDSLKVISMIGSTFLSFSLKMLVAAPIISMLGPLINLSVGVMTGIVDKLSTVGKKSKDANKASDTLKSLGIGMLAFASSLIIFGFVKPQALLMATASMALMIGFVYAVKGAGKDTEIKNRTIGLAIGITALAISALIFNAVDWGSIGKLAVTLTMLTVFTYMISGASGSKNNKNLGLTMLMLAGGTFALGLSALLYNAVDWGSVFKMLAVLTGMTVAVIVLGTADKASLKGSLALILISSALVITSFAVDKFKGIEWKTVGIMAAVVLGASLIAIGLGAPVVSEMAFMGAIILNVIGFALVQFSESLLNISEGLLKFKQSNWTKEDTGNLLGALTGITAGIIPIGASLALISPGIQAARSMGKMIEEIASGMIVWKNAGITEADAIAAGRGVGQLLTNVKLPIEEIGKSGGFLKRSDFAKGVSSLKDLGSILSSLAIGVKNMASMSFVDPITKEVVKLTQQDYTNAGENIKALIGADTVNGKTTSPLAEAIKSIGMSEGLFGGPFSRGVNSLKKLGSTLSELAKGVSDMANGTYTDPILKMTFRIGPTEYAAAAANINQLIGEQSPLRKAIFDIGNAGNWLTGNEYNKGIEVTSKMGRTLVDMADGIIKMSTKTFVDPASGKTITLNESHYQAAAANISALVGNEALRKAVVELGKGNWFTGNDYKQGMKVASEMGSMISNSADGIIKLASGVYPDPTDPKKTLPIGPAQFTAAGNNLGLLFTALATPIGKLGRGELGDLGQLKDGMKVSKDLAQLISTMGSTAKTFYDTIGTRTTFNEIAGLAQVLANPFGSGINFDVSKQMMNNVISTSNALVKLANSESLFAKIANHTMTISNGIVNMTNSIAKMDMTKNSQLSAIFKDLIELAKLRNPFKHAENFLEKIEETKPDKALEGVLSAIKEISIKTEKTNEGGDKMVELLTEISKKLDNVSTSINALAGKFNKPLLVKEV